MAEKPEKKTSSASLRRLLPTVIGAVLALAAMVAAVVLLTFPEGGDPTNHEGLLSEFHYESSLAPFTPDSYINPDGGLNISIPELAPQLEGTLIPQTQRGNETYLNDTVFVGDSITEGMILHNYVPRSQIFGIRSLTMSQARWKTFVRLTDGRVLTIAEAVRIRQPGKIVITLGINAIGQTKANFYNQYAAFVDDLRAASPESVIIIQALMPVCRTLELSRPIYNNERIDEYNLLLATLARDKGCYFLYTPEVFKIAGNDSNPDYHNDDGLHINAAGYQVMLDYIMTHTVRSNGTINGINFDGIDLPSKPPEVLDQSEAPESGTESGFGPTDSDPYTSSGTVDWESNVSSHWWWDTSYPLPSYPDPFGSTSSAVSSREEQASSSDTVTDVPPPISSNIVSSQAGGNPFV